MDSVSQITLGAAVSVAVMGRRTAVWKAALWGAAAGTMPDLDVLIDYGDPIRNMVLHRAETHSLFWLSLVSLPLAAAAAKVHGQWAIWRRWWLALWLVLVTHPLLDTMTVYGTQLALPFSNHPFGVGSIFIIDPLYTLPLLIGVGWALWRGGDASSGTNSGPARMAPNTGLAMGGDSASGSSGHWANRVGLLLSCLYLLWSVAAQAHVTPIARESLRAQGIAADHVLVTPSAFNTVLWRIVAIDGESYHEGFYSLLDDKPQISFDRFARGQALGRSMQHLDGVRRIMAFSKGFYSVQQQNGQLLIRDLRMGQEPNYVFSFAVARPGNPPQPLASSQQISSRPDIERGLRWLWRRMQGELLSPPR